MSTVRERHPSPVWDNLDMLRSELARFNLDVEPLDFLRLMGDADLDQIRNVAKNVWGDDANLFADANDITVVGALSNAQDGLGDEVDDLEDTWNAVAFEQFSHRARMYQDVFKDAAVIAKDVADGLREFADACDVTIADKLGLIGSYLGAVGGLAGSLVAATAVSVALAEFAVAIVFAYLIYLGLKSIGAQRKLNELRGKLPPMPQ